MKLKTLLMAGMVMVPATITAQSAQAAGYCREYGNTIRVGGNIEAGYGTVCLQPDESWKVVVSSGNNRHYDDRRDGRHDNRHYDNRRDGHNQHKAKKHVKHAHKNPYYYGYSRPYYQPIKRFPPGHFRRYSQMPYYHSINPHNHRHTPHCGHRH